jgi:hypothetical protein
MNIFIIYNILSSLLYLVNNQKAVVVPDYNDCEESNYMLLRIACNMLYSKYKKGIITFNYNDEQVVCIKPPNKRGKTCISKCQ